MGFLQGTQERARNSCGKRAISVPAIEVLLYIISTYRFVLFQVETIGDAYCVAGGLHRKSPYHALQIAWMALRMMDYANKQKSHDGKTIQVHQLNILKTFRLRQDIETMMMLHKLF